MGFFIDPSTLPTDMGGSIQVCFLGAIYSYVLYNASNLIADGSELLLLIPGWEQLVGSIVLPILGAVPDGAMVMFSGMGENAAEEIAVGVGTLAGSTIMLLTLPFAASIFNGMVPTRSDGSPDYSKRTQKVAWNKGSSGNSKLIKKSGYFMGITGVSYLVVQIPAFYYLYEKLRKKQMVLNEANWEILAIAICTTLFCYYIWMCYSQDDGENPNANVINQKAQMKTIQLLQEGIVNIEQVVKSLDMKEKPESLGFTKPLVEQNAQEKKAQEYVRTILQPLFDEVDDDCNGMIVYEEAYLLLKTLSAGTYSSAEIRKVFTEHDADSSGDLNLDEFCELVWNFVTRPKFSNQIMTMEDGSGDVAGDEESDGCPEDLKDLPEEKRSAKIMRRAFGMLLMGTFLVLSFSDPMVGVLNELGARSGIPAFYLAFIVAPLASNAAEAVASTKFSAKKTAQTMEVSLSALVGAAIMNNTFCLLVFLILTYVQNIPWTFGPEVLSILFVEMAMLFYTQRDFFNYKDAFCILTLYPLSLLFISFAK